MGRRRGRRSSTTVNITAPAPQPRNRRRRTARAGPFPRYYTSSPTATVMCTNLTWDSSGNLMSNGVWVTKTLDAVCTGKTLIAMQLRSEVGTDGWLDVRMGPNGLFSPWHHAHDQKTTGHLADSMWVFKPPLSWETMKGIVQFGTAPPTRVGTSEVDGIRARGAVAPADSLQIKIYFSQSGMNGPLGYTFNPLTPMDLDNPTR